PSSVRGRRWRRKVWGRQKSVVMMRKQKRSTTLPHVRMCPSLLSRAPFRSPCCVSSPVCGSVLV
ncbi:hypothetical protein KUCAC02_008213, partial [Chaenocephalus aceratus]